MIKRILRTLAFGIKLLRVGGFGEFLKQLKRQIYSRDIQIGFVRNLEDTYDKNLMKSEIAYSLVEASREDIEEAFRKVRTESKEAAPMLLSREWLYELGCGKWYVARTVDTNELCFLQCVITAEDNKLYDKGFQDWFPRLKEDELIMEAAYSFEKFRGHHIPRPVMFEILQMYKDKGFKHMILYIDKSKEYLLRKSDERGFSRFEEVCLSKTFFFSKRKSRPYQSRDENKQPGSTLKNRTKKLVTGNQFLSRLYNPLKFLNFFSFGNILNLVKNIGKTRLMLTVRAYTMLDFPPLVVLYDSARHLEKAELNGSFVECGVRNGGSAAVIAAAARKNVDRHTWLFDSWEGFPEPEEIDITFDNKPAEKGGCLGQEETVRELVFDKLKLDPARVHLVKGWFSDTIPETNIGPIALLHLHCDLYDSSKFCLEQLYDDVIPGGRIFIDDYRIYKGSKKAFDEFVNSRNINVKLINLGTYGVYFDKS